MARRVSPKGYFVSWGFLLLDLKPLQALCWDVLTSRVIRSFADLLFEKVRLEALAIIVYALSTHLLYSFV